MSFLGVRLICGLELVDLFARDICLKALAFDKQALELGDVLYWFGVDARSATSLSSGHVRGIELSSLIPSR